MVTAITPISAASPSAVAQIWRSISIAGSESTWVAARQSQVSFGLNARETREAFALSRPFAEGHDNESQDTRSLMDRRYPDSLTDFVDEFSSARLSGESPRIGTAYFDEGTPFGSRFVIV